MEMHHHAGYEGLPQYLAMWMAMMVPMMLPSLVPMLLRYRWFVQGAGGMRLHGLTVLVGASYFAFWVVIGVAAWAVSTGVMVLEMLWGWAGEWKPLATGVVLLVAGGVQISSCKARQLALWRKESVRGGPPAASAQDAWRHGLRIGVQCGFSCGPLMVALVAIGMMNVVAMVAMTIVIAAERLETASLPAARMAGAVIVVLGVLTIARA